MVVKQACVMTASGARNISLGKASCTSLCSKKKISIRQPSNPHKPVASPQLPVRFVPAARACHARWAGKTGINGSDMGGNHVAATPSDESAPRQSQEIPRTTDKRRDVCLPPASRIALHLDLLYLRVDNLELKVALSLQEALKALGGIPLLEKVVLRLRLLLHGSNRLLLFSERWVIRLVAVVTPDGRTKVSSTAMAMATAAVSATRGVPVGHFPLALIVIDKSFGKSSLQ